MNSMLQAAKDTQDYILQLRNYFHQHPEISGKEVETAKKVADELQQLGYQVKTSVGSSATATGVIGTMVFPNKGKTIALRADMDALQIEEQNDVEYKSKNCGVMHACGHDAHVAMLLGVAKILSENKETLQGKIVLIFQPAEELSPNGGSRDMINQKVLEGVDAVFGLHVWPDMPVGTVGVKAGPLMASSDHFTVTINGKSSHAAQPNDGIDAVVMGAQYINAIQGIISREISPLSSAVITVGKFNAGTRYNIVAESCQLEGTCRTFDEDVRNYIELKLQKVLDGICTAHDATGTLNYERGYMAVINDAVMTETIKKTAVTIFGQENVTDILEPSMCAEDFSFYLKEKPGSFVWLGTGVAGQKNYPLHNSRFDIDIDALWHGTALMAQVFVDTSSN